jgi:hypothetical protein
MEVSRKLQVLGFLTNYIYLQIIDFSLLILTVPTT